VTDRGEKGRNGVKTLGPLAVCLLDFFIVLPVTAASAELACH
jgi:hypothetical protein